MHDSAGPVRLPPVSVPHDDDYLPPPPGAFNQLRRVSLSDPFRHAYPQQGTNAAISNPHPPSPTSVDPNGDSGYAASSRAVPIRAGDEDTKPDGTTLGAQPRLGSPRSGSPTNSYYRAPPPHGHHATAPPPPPPAAAPQHGYTYGNGPYAGPPPYQHQSHPPPPPTHRLHHTQPPPPPPPMHHHPQGSGMPPPQSTGGPPPQHQLGPTSNYRFGGPPQPAPHEPTSYFDYSMRRHSLSTGNGGGGQPGSGAPSPVRRISGDGPQPLGNLKRKTSGEDTIHEEEGYPSTYAYANTIPSHPQNAPYPKRRGSSITYDKMSNLSLAEQQARRDSGMSSQSNLSPWEDDRRGSGGSWTSVGSQGYSMAGYAVDPYDQRAPGSAGGPPPPGMYDSPRGSLTGPGGLEVEGAYGRRPSIGIGQLVQGSANYAPPPGQYARPGPGALPSVAHSPPEEDDNSPTSAHGPGPARGHSHHGSYSSITGPPVAPPSGPWRSSSTTSVQLESTLRRDSRQDSTGSLDSMAYDAGGVPKDSPYARSPELRVTHKLAERKRRKEMAQLFDDLRDALPVDRGLKSSKWEILTKAVDFIEQLKATNVELGKDNARLRAHVGLGPVPSSVPPMQSPQMQGQEQTHQAPHGAHDQYDQRSHDDIRMAPLSQHPQHYQSHSRHPSDYGHSQSASAPSHIPPNHHPHQQQQHGPPSSGASSEYSAEQVPTQQQQQQQQHPHAHHHQRQASYHSIQSPQQPPQQPHAASVNGGSDRGSPSVSEGSRLPQPGPGSNAPLSPLQMDMDVAAAASIAKAFSPNERAVPELVTGATSSAPPVAIEATVPAA